MVLSISHNHHTATHTASQAISISGAPFKPTSQNMQVTELVQRSLSVTDFFHPAVLMIQSDGRKYTAVRTFPNEASILHALFGNPKQDVLFSANCRTLFVTKLKERLKDLKVQAALDSILKTYREFYNNEIPNQAYSQVNARNAKLLFSNNNDIEITHVSVEMRQTIQLRRYEQACKKNSYSFTRIDLELIAHVLKIKILVYSHLSTLEYTVGHFYKEQVVLIEEVHSIHTGNFHPSYQRCQPRNAVKNAWDNVWNDNYTIKDAQKVEVIFEISQYFVNGIEKIVLEYADLNFADPVNNSMQAILESEGWNRTIKSAQNWNIARKLRKTVTHIKYPGCSDHDQLKRMHDIVCQHAFPMLNSIEFGELPSSEEYRKVIVQNPNLRALTFQRISLDDLNSLCKAASPSFSRIEDFAVRLSTSKATNNPSPTTTAIADIFGNVMKSFSNLLRISVNPSILPSDSWFQIITKQFPNIRYLDFNYKTVPIELIKKYIETKKQNLRSLDLQLLPDNQTRFTDARIDEGHLTIRSSILRSDGTLMPFLATLPMLSELDISRIKFSSNEFSHLRYCKGLRILKMRGCCDNVIEAISKLTLLEELDLTECKIDISRISPLGNLTRLRILHWGNFCTSDTLGTSKFAEALKAVLPNVELKTKELYNVIRYKRTEVRYAVK